MHHEQCFWIVAPAAFAWFFVPDIWCVIQDSPADSLRYAYLFGVLWGFGSLTFGLSKRYLGIALAYAVALGLCALLGTLVPPIYNGQFAQLLAEPSGQVVFLGVAICAAGIVFSAAAGMSKERELTDEQKSASVTEFSFTKGIAVATCAGLLSACFSFGLSAGEPIVEQARELLLEHNYSDLWQNLPVLVVILWGGFTTNLLWCLALNIKNSSWGEYFSLPKSSNTGEIRLLPNYFFSALAGLVWYMQFFFYSMGSTKMGKYDFFNWTLHMAAIIIFSTFWGIALREWRGTSRKTKVLIGLGLTVLILSTIVVGYGNFLQGKLTT